MGGLHIPRDQFFETAAMAFQTLVLLLAASLVAGQGTTVVCYPEWGWANNSLSQSPCLVASYLLSVCVTNTTLDPIAAENSYDPPVDKNPCVCSTLTYSLISACGLCQESQIMLWSTWSIGCSPIYDRQYNETIPSETTVPGWAYLDVITNDTFDAVAAQAFANRSSSTTSSTGSATYPTSSPTKTGGSQYLDAPRVIWSCLAVLHIYNSLVL